MNRVFHEIPLRCVKPEGWLRQYLVNQRDGLTGHLEHAGFPFTKAAWSSPGYTDQYDADMADSWWPYEQNGYWVDGMVRCGYLLDDDFLIAKVKRHLDNVLDNPAPDGFLGPEILRVDGKVNRWVHAVFFRAAMAYHSATGDPRVVAALAAHYLNGMSAHIHDREVCNVEVMLWLYEKTGDKRLLDLAIKAYDGFCTITPDSDCTLENMLFDRISTEHGVTFNETAKLGALIYIYTGRERYLDATMNAYKKLERDSVLVDGVCSSSEHLGGKDALESHETCDITDYAWSLGYLLQATGEAQYADKIERACLNAAPGAVDSRFRSLQYFSCPNQVIADKASNHNLYYRGTERMSYRLISGAPCCPGSVNRIMPNYISKMWMEDGEGGIAAALYGPCRLSANVGRERRDIVITEETDYPFRDTIRFRIETESSVRFALHLRIPGWCGNASVTVNGMPLDIALMPGTFAKIEREFLPGDVIALTLPMSLKLSCWPEGGVALERGPLVYSLRIAENWQKDPEETRCSEEFPAWNLYPASQWNFALCVSEDTLKHDVEVIEHAMTDNPWSIDAAPVELLVPARLVKGWTMEEKDTVQRYAWFGSGYGTREIAGRFRLTPPLPDPEGLADRLCDRLERIALVPYGCTTLRVTIFPNGSGLAGTDGNGSG